MARRFVDARGTEWEVWEVGAQRRPADAPPQSRRRELEDEAPCLLFDSATQRRRLARYPASWHAMSPQALAALCAAARPEPRVLPRTGTRSPTSPSPRG